MDQVFDLRNRVVVITGASSGIGEHLARTAAAAGALVVACARREDRLQSLASRIRDCGGVALPVRLDVTDPASIEAVFGLVQAEFGRCDVLVNNAGIAAPARSVDVSASEAADVWAVNVQGPFAMAQRAARLWMDTSRAGVIVNVASILGLTAAAGVATYCATKAALTNLTRSLAVEWARHGIRVNALAPGYLRTELNRERLDGDLGASLLRRIPMRRFGELDDLTGPFLLLASDASRFMTGSVLVVDGGHTSWA